MQFGELAVAIAHLIRDGLACLRRLGLGDRGALRLQLGGDLLVDRGLGLRDLLLRRFELRLAAAKIGLLGGKLLLELPAGLRDQGRGELLGELDLGPAGGADDRWIGHDPHPSMEAEPNRPPRGV